MAYVASVKGKPGPPLYRTTKSVKSYVPDSATYIADAKYAYSYRTGRRGRYDTLQLGEAKMPTSIENAGGLLPYLEAEKTAIRELSSEVESASLLGEGTWNMKDSGHVFATLSQRSSLWEYSMTEKSTGLETGLSMSLHSPYVDPFTYDLLKSSTFRWGADNGILVPALKRKGLTRQDIADECAQVVLGSSPDQIQGGIGESLVDLVNLPRLLVHAKELVLKSRDIKRTWDRLDRAIQKDVDRAFADPAWAVSNKLTGKSADAFLYFSFVLKPLISDVQLLLQFAARLSGSVQESTKRVRKVSEKRWDDLDNRLTLPGRFPNANATGYTIGSHGFVRSKVVSTHVLSYDVLIHSKWRRAVLSDNGFLARANEVNIQLGFWYPSLVWDLVPFSFVVDWFLHLGNVVDGARALSNGDYQLDYSWATIKGHSGIIVNDVAPITPSLTSNLLVRGRPAFSNFQSRFPVDPINGLKPKWSSLTGGQQLLATALGFSMLKINK